MDMDAQKISEAASTIKKVERANRWFRDITKHSAEKIDISTSGNITMWDGHGEALHYIRIAMNTHRQEIINLAIRLAEMDKQAAQEVIRTEASREASDLL
jgi:hypothetical protein